VQWLITRRLAVSAARLKSARESLRVLDEQAMSLHDDADSLEPSAVIDETGHRAYEHRKAAEHADVADRERARLRERIVALERKQDELLDRLQAHRR
jgi:hypothetical protein